MTNIAAFLLVLTLTGSPVTSIVCAAECQDGPVTSGHCHSDMARSDGSMVSANDRCADPSISDSPYVTEYRAVSGAAVLIITPSPTAPELVRTGAPAPHVRPPAISLKSCRVLRI